jgi:hypothetical protein
MGQEPHEGMTRNPVSRETGTPGLETDRVFSERQDTRPRPGIANRPDRVFVGPLADHLGGREAGRSSTHWRRERPPGHGTRWQGGEDRPGRKKKFPV